MNAVILSTCTVESHVDSSSDPVTEILRGERQKVVEQALDTLEVRRREALLAWIGIHPDGRTVADLAKCWGVSRQRVYTISKQARMLLRQDLEAFK